MSEIELRTSMDTRELVARLETAARQTVNALRRSVDRTARAARKDAIKTMSADIGVPKSTFSKSVPPVRGSTEGSISATWTTSKARISALKVGSFTPVLSELRGSFSGSTFRLTGGGSSSLQIGKSFVMRASNGAVLLMVRHGGEIKAIYAEMPSTGLGQDDGAPRKTWTQVAERELAKNVASEMSAALAGASRSPIASSSDE